MGLHGNRVIQLRKALNMTQAELSDRIGLRQNQVSRYEKGAYNPSVETLQVMAQVLNTSTDYLLGLSNVPHPGAEPDPHPDLSPAEREMLHLLRQYDERGKETLVEMVRLAGKVRPPAPGDNA